LSDLQGFSKTACPIRWASENHDVRTMGTVQNPNCPKSWVHFSILLLCMSGMLMGQGFQGFLCVGGGITPTTPWYRIILIKESQKTCRECILLLFLLPPVPGTLMYQRFQRFLCTKNDVKRCRCVAIPECG